jgi:hypothetical protein
VPESRRGHWLLSHATPTPAAQGAKGRSSASSRGIPAAAERALALQRRAGTAATARRLQRRVLTIGDEDAEVRFAARRLLEETGLPLGRFDEVDQLRDNQAEIIVGHGTLLAIGGLDPKLMADRLAAKMVAGTHFTVIFMACRAGEGVAEAPSLARAVHQDLTARGFDLSIEAPRGLAIVFAAEHFPDARSYLVTPTLPTPPPARRATATAAALSGPQEYVRSFLTQLDEDVHAQSAELKRELAVDAGTLHSKQLTRLRPGPKTKNKPETTPLMVFADAVAEALTRGANARSLKNTWMILRELEVVKKLMVVDGLLTGEELGLLIEEREEEAQTAEKATVVSARNDPRDIRSGSTARLDPAAWEVSGSRRHPTPSYIS